MSPVAIIGGTFVLWIAARKRLPLYAALVNKSAASSSPSSSSNGNAAANPTSGGIPNQFGFGPGNDPLGDLFSKVWEGLKEGAE